MAVTFTTWSYFSGMLFPLRKTKYLDQESHYGPEDLHRRLSAYLTTTF